MINNTIISYCIFTKILNGDRKISYQYLMILNIIVMVQGKLE